MNEILAHEEAGWELDIFSLYPPNDERFQDVISLVKAPVTYIRGEAIRGEFFWDAFGKLALSLPDAPATLPLFSGESAREVYQGMLLAVEVVRRGISHLHAHFGTAPASVARVAARLARISYSFTAHAKDIYHDSVAPEELRRKMRDAAAVVTVSDFNANHLRNHYGPDAARLVRIYNGIDLERFEFEPYSHRPPVIVSVGRLVEKKGFHVLVEACARLRERGIGFQCRIIGSGPLEDALGRQIADRDLTPHVHLLGALPQGEVLGEIRRAALFAGPYVVGADGNRDGLPTVLLESMALGTPCVATAVTGVPEAIVPEETGLLLPEATADALADAMQRLIEDPLLAAALARSARELVERRFDVRRNTGELRQMFSRIAGVPEEVAAR